MKTFIAWVTIQLLVGTLLYGSYWFWILKVDPSLFMILNFSLSSASVGFWSGKFTVEQGVPYRIRAIMTIPACIYIVPFTSGLLGIVFSSSFREELGSSSEYPFLIIPLWVLCAYLCYWLRYRRPHDTSSEGG